jgi:hypothetical protein
MLCIFSAFLLNFYSLSELQRPHEPAFSKFFLQWFMLIFPTYLALVAVQYLFIIPIETMMAERNGALVSLLYLTHAGRVLGHGWSGQNRFWRLLPPQSASILRRVLTLAH